MKVRLSIFAVVILGSCFFAEDVNAQSIIGNTNVACTASDKLAVTSFSAHPTNPNVGQTVSVRMRIKNKCPAGSKALTVRWHLVRNTNNLSTGDVTINPGAETGDLTATWTASAGAQDFFGVADPELAISETNRTNNTSPHVAVLPTTSRFMTMSNGSFPKNFEGPTGPCSMTINQMGDGMQIATVLSCSSSFNGLKANPEYFKGVTLQNGWKVESVKIHSDGVISGGQGGWSWQVKPAVGSADPRVQVHVWVNRHTAFQYYLEMTIRGPAHLSPF